MLGSYPLTAFVGTHNPDLAKRFYAGTLGLRLISEDKYGLAFDAHGTILRLVIVQDLVAAKYSVIGWEVADLEAEVRALHQAGVPFAKLEVSKQQDELGIWTTPEGDRVAWITDPDGNVLSIMESSREGKKTNKNGAEAVSLHS